MEAPAVGAGRRRERHGRWGQPQAVCLAPPPPSAAPGGRFATGGAGFAATACRPPTDV